MNTTMSQVRAGDSLLSPPGPNPVGQPYVSIPEGWYCVAFSRDVRRGKVKSLTAFGTELVLYRTASGQAKLVGAYCPHMGAHFGHGGKVAGDELECPFHGFRFDGSGACTATPYGHKAPKAPLECWELREFAGLILAYYHPAGGAPTWEPTPLDMDGWTPFALAALPEFRGHPQECTENSVDFGHFSFVHGFSDVTELQPARAAGERLTASYRIDYRLMSTPATMRVHFDVLVHGLGYSVVLAQIPGWRLKLRYLVLATPVSADRVVLRLGSAMHGKNKLVRGLNRVLVKALMPAYLRETRQDLAIWQHKRYVERPKLAKGDGPIMRYRKYCRQFYPHTSPDDHADQ